MRVLIDEALEAISDRFEGMYARTGRPSVPPERLIRALLLQVLYTIRSERQLMEQLDYNLLFRWFVGFWRWTTRCGTRRRSARTGTGCWQAERSRIGLFEAVLEQAEG